MLDLDSYNYQSPGANLAKLSLLRKIGWENVVILFLTTAPTLRGWDGLGSLIKLHFLNRTKTCQVYGGTAKQHQDTTRT